MNCVECKKEFVKNVGTEENPLCEDCYDKMKIEYGNENQAHDKNRHTIKPGINMMMLGGFLICVVMTMILFQMGDYGSILGQFGLIMCIICFIGLILSSISSSITGPVLVIIGCVLFVPIGLIGILGAQKAMKEFKAKQKKF
jgi:hypothetical protein